MVWIVALHNFTPPVHFEDGFEGILLPLEWEIYKEAKKKNIYIFCIKAPKQLHILFGYAVVQNVSQEHSLFNRRLWKHSYPEMYK